MYSAVTGQVPTSKSRIPPISGHQRKIPALAQVVIISPPEDKKGIEAEQLKNEVMQLIDPSKEEI